MESSECWRFLELPKPMRRWGRTFVAVALLASGTAAAAPKEQEAIAALDRLLDLLDQPRKRSLVEADWSKTRDIAVLEIAWAFVRVGKRDRGETMSRKPLERLRSGDAVERHVAELYAARIEGKGNAHGELALSRDERYVVRRLVAASMVLAPREFTEPFSAFVAETKDRCLDAGALLEMETRKTAEVATLAELEVALHNLPADPQTTRKRTQALFRAAARLGLPAVLHAADLTKNRWATTTDLGSTNTHFCLAVVTFIDERAFAIAEAVNPIQDGPR